MSCTKHTYFFPLKFFSKHFLIRRKFQELPSRYLAYLKANYRSADLSGLSGVPESRLYHSSWQFAQNFCSWYTPPTEKVLSSTHGASFCQLKIKNGEKNQRWRPSTVFSSERECLREGVWERTSERGRLREDVLNFERVNLFLCTPTQHTELMKV
jgi:hypothetical protein